MNRFGMSYVPVSSPKAFTYVAFGWQTAPTKVLAGY